MGGQSPRAKLDRVSTACRNCRQRKVRCSGDTPCKDCVRLQKQCVYPPAQRRKRNTQGHASLQSSEAAHGAQLERVWDTRETSDQANDGAACPHKHGARSTNTTRDVYVRPEPVPSSPWLSLETSHNQNPLDLPTLASLSDENHTDRRTSTINAGRFPNQQPSQGQTQPTESSWQYHEPWSWMSICSPSGSKWIQTMIGSNDFTSIAKRCAQDMAQDCSSKDYILTIADLPETSQETAEKYVDAFFENCWEASLGIVDRADIEKIIYSNHNTASDDDPAMCALKNIVFATGYRSLLARDPAESFSTVQDKAGNYFRGALSVLTRLLVPPSGLTAVRAVTLMVRVTNNLIEIHADNHKAAYSEGLGNPPFKHFLCSNAVHLALSKGLHRQADPAWGISDGEATRRSWLWWVIYSLEKHLALSGVRPSSIDDENISVQIPTQVPVGSTIQLESVSISHRHAKLHSQITRQLLSLKALSMSTVDLMGSVTRFHDQLEQLLEEIPPELRIGTLARPPHTTRRLIPILFVHFSIYGSIMAIHSHFFYPWMLSRLCNDQSNKALDEQIAISSTAVAEAARKIILALRLVNANATTPSWLSLFYPVHAAINLFLYIIKYPTLSTASADLGLLDVCAGHFGYIEYLTSSKVSISFPRDAASIASKVVKEARSVDPKPPAADDPGPIHRQGAPAPESRVDGNAINFDSLDHDLTMLNNLQDFADLDVANWGLLSSFDIIS